ncbi:ABC transporter ATP-binding protein [Bradyrhizobium sp. U87765 SZCCT0131]|uniref:ABC transporter ATP-binding protein n=1 Tax=unclassified Bradyrhizobium TaxID=2631580 RepID=UPI001BAE0DE2|nr:MULTISPECIES: ATP-binding cassette domain-containing protein [unclassified Bradyrhizobium]MBR1221573.1 ABC transporter ATP-binding protein [Bradyrhizobium sp. U87765 SZCCT0131]MBR1264504.1 ABC transporter ATP-binding protein [Bradyrhizobium sp. U87765 SZCCT0134]MBR1304589.1 ABC transporter ATP-binding protein [Bradyrhizobium sp. U87765 SZCCT0110]MBR1322554.1 ABC transporter ATP-binding protein [Bradyrhizobium sp. U87765 SZCCT0109]MBR1346518.1 ABC transporter ATP-binding protein [Bradyrhizob
MARCSRSPERCDSTAAATVLSLRSVSRAFGAVAVAEDISFDVAVGDAVGIIGPNGAGKTSLFNLISGDLAPGSGLILMSGCDVTALGARRRSRLGVARTYQVPLPFVGLSVFENVLVGAVFAARDQQAAPPEARALDVLKRTGLLRLADMQAGALTLLDRKRLELARALATQPELLLLDEIAGGLTEAECLELVELIKAIHLGGTTVIWIEHIVHALLSVVQRLIVLDRGRIVAQGEPHGVMRSSQVREIYLGMEPDTDVLQ